MLGLRGSRWFVALATMALTLACGGNGAGGSSFGDESDGGSVATDDPTQGSTTSSGPDTDTEAETDSLILDVGASDLPPERPPSCAAEDLEQLQRSDEPPPCNYEAPPESFSPVLEWSFGDDMAAETIPLVANMTDDNDDGVIDLCDTPDVVLVAKGEATPCAIYVLDGATGALHFQIDDGGVYCEGTAAVGDIDDDGEVEIVAVSSADDDRLVAFDTDGTLMWVSEPRPDPQGFDMNAWNSNAIALHDINGDGQVEVVYNHIIYDNEGTILWWEEELGWFTFQQASVAVDLDGDGRLEIVTAYSAYSFDDQWNGTPIWNLLLGPANVDAYSVPQVANFDDDPMPEVLLTNSDGFFMIEHDGTYKWGNDPIKPIIDIPCNANGWQAYTRPAAITDFDGDGDAEIVASSCETLAIYDVWEVGMTTLWQGTVQDASGGSGSTAFDFLGDDTPEPVYSDEVSARAWSGVDAEWPVGETFNLARRSPTYIEYPVVADVDNDGSAEILVVSWGMTTPDGMDPDAPALQVFGDAEDRWIATRRIWNQHAYYVTNVREDGTIPAEPIDNWDYLNTYRANTQAESGVLCQPPG